MPASKFNQELAARSHEARRTLLALEEDFVRDVVHTVVFPAIVEFDTARHFFRENSEERRKDRIRERARVRMQATEAEHDKWQTSVQTAGKRKSAKAALDDAVDGFENLLSVSIPGGDVAMRYLVNS